MEKQKTQAMSTKKFAVVISGCGVYDGAEIHEATMTLYAIARNGAEYQVFAPDIEQHHVINHVTGEEMPEKRNVLVESARIARGNIKPLSEFKPEDFDAIIFPGGYGVAKNLTDFAFKGADCNVNKEVENAVKAMAELKKPIGALCISPAMMARIFPGATVTVGNDKETVEQIEKMGSKHQVTTHGEVVVDENLNLYTTPCYMLSDATIVNVHDCAMNIVKKMLENMK